VLFRSVWFLSAIRFASGVASAFSMVFISAIVFEFAKKVGRTVLVAVQFAGVGIGITISAAVVSGLGDLGQPWQSHWLVSGLIGLVAFLIVVFLIKPSIRSKLDVDLMEDNPGLKSSHKGGVALSPGVGGGGKSIKLLIVSYGLFGFGYVITATFISEMASSIPQLAGARNNVWLMVGIAAIFSTFLLNFVASRFGAMRTYGVACLVEAIAVLASVLFLDPIVLLVSAFVFGGTFVGITALGLVTATQIANQGSPQTSSRTGAERRILALMTAAFGLGQVIGPWFAGWLFDMQGDLILASICAAAALAISGVLGFASGQIGQNSVR